MITRLLIANRGEIACRIARTCTRLGITPITIYSPHDRNLPHAKDVKESYEVESYLSIEEILRVAKESEAEAIHPGYGFLSENSAFAQAVQEAGILFIGPSPGAITLMGDKVRARECAEMCEVAVVPGVTLSGETGGALLEKVEFIGYPLLIKAAGGGGGRGMRKVYAPDALEEQLKAASREAGTFFGKAEVFIEKLIEYPRHIEVQGLGDQYGNVLCLSDRDCSMQRSHQKVIEEAPAPELPSEIREKLYQWTTRIFQKAQYCGAGTAEFLYDRKGDVYFLEVNSRLQVEHPVTEEVLGVDLVELQIRVAEGLDLSKAGVRTSPRSASIEVRLCAEDPALHFKPSTGLIHELDVPSRRGVRFDTGFDAGNRVTHYYDSLLGKIIATAPTRDEALNLLIHTLKETKVGGLSTNLPYLLTLLESREFREVDHHVQLAETFLPSAKEVAKQRALMASAAVLEAVVPSDGSSPWSSLVLFRNAGVGEEKRFAEIEGELFEVHVRCEGGCYPIRTFHLKSLKEKEEFEFCLTRPKREGQKLSFLLDGHTEWIEKSGESWILSSRGGFSYRPSRPILTRGGDGASDAQTRVKANLPGKILEVKISLGDTVRKGDVLAVLESMKMEHPIASPMEGKVVAVSANAGAVVEGSAILFEIDPKAAD